LITLLLLVHHHVEPIPWVVVHLLQSMHQVLHVIVNVGRKAHLSVLVLICKFFSFLLVTVQLLEQLLQTFDGCLLFTVVLLVTGFL
jgi:hypothetical protein